jgi:hypothetical protein
MDNPFHPVDPAAGEVGESCESSPSADGCIVGSATRPDVGAGQACLSIWEPGAALPGLEHVGACLLP